MNLFQPYYFLTVVCWLHLFLTGNFYLFFFVLYYNASNNYDKMQAYCLIFFPIRNSFNHFQQMACFTFPPLYWRYDDDHGVQMTQRKMLSNHQEQIGGCKVAGLTISSEFFSTGTFPLCLCCEKWAENGKSQVPNCIFHHMFTVFWWTLSPGVWLKFVRLMYLLLQIFFFLLWLQ